MKTSMLSVKGGKSKGVFGVEGMFSNDFGIGDMRGDSFVAIEHSCSELVEILRLFVFAFMCPLDNQN